MNRLTAACVQARSGISLALHKIYDNLKPCGDVMATCDIDSLTEDQMRQVLSLIQDSVPTFVEQVGRLIDMSDQISELSRKFEAAIARTATSDMANQG